MGRERDTHCPVCSDRLKRLYIRSSSEGRQSFKGIGWICMHGGEDLTRQFRQRGTLWGERLKDCKEESPHITYDV